MDSYTRSSLVFPVLDVAPPGESLGTVVLLHGFPQGPSSWSSVIPQLTSAGYRAVLPTLRGYAATARPSGVKAYAIDELCADVLTLIETLDDGPVHLVGHDWGAIIAWAFAARHPSRLLSVTGVSVPPLKSFKQGLQNPRQLRSSWYVGAFNVPGLVEAGSRSSQLQAFLVRSLVSSGQTRDLASRDIHALLDSPGGLIAAISYYRAMRFGVWRQAGEITTPALFVWSTGDTAITSAATRSAARSVAGHYRSATLLGVSHWIPEAAPTELAALILEHVRVS